MRNKLLASLFAGAVALLAFSRNHDFPVDYHPDEAGKAAQIITPSQPRNYNQPLMMLEAANVARQAFHVPADIPAVTIAGRWTSAFFAAAAVFALALAAGWKAGPTAAAFVGLTLALCPPLLVYAHYFKEDTALIAGIALAMLGARWLIAARTARGQLGAAAIVGIGCAAAASGKYVGAVVLAPALFAAVIAPLPKRWMFPARLLAIVIAGAVGVMLIDARTFAGFFPPRLLEIAKEQIVTEFHHGTTGHDYLALAVPNTYCLRIAASEVMPHIWIFLALGLAAVIGRRKFTRWGIVCAAFLATFVAVLCWNPIPFARYALPITVLVYFLAAQLMIAVIGHLNRTAARNAAWTACFGAVAILGGQRCLNFTRQFRDDSRQRLREWVAQNLPADAVIVEDRYVVLESPGDPDRFPSQTPVKAQIQRRFVAADAASSLDELAANGVQYVAVAQTNYDRFFQPGAYGLFPREPDFDRRRNFYAELFSRGELIWSSRPSPPTHAYVNPELRLYRIAVPASN